MKDNIPGNKNRMRIKIKELIAFDITRITKENTFSCSWIELISSLSNGRSKTQAAKHFEMIVIWCLMKKKFKMCFIIQQRRGKSIKSINEIGSS